VFENAYFKYTKIGVFMVIFVIGLTSSGLWGMEYHNLGNYVILEPLIKELKKTFPQSQIKTTMQLGDDFCQKFKIESLKNKTFWLYGSTAILYLFVDFLLVFCWYFFYILGFRCNFFLRTPFLKQLSESDLVIDFSGDIYGDNATLKKFLLGSGRMLLAKMLGKRVSFFIASPGPFASLWKRTLAKFVLNRVDLITCREPFGAKILQKIGVGKVHSLACPAFLYSPSASEMKYPTDVVTKNPGKASFGFILCGWNMPVGPFNRWPRNDVEYSLFVDLLVYLIKDIGVSVYLMSHQNATTPDGGLIEGNDHRILKKLLQLARQKGLVETELCMIEGCYTAAQSRAIISNFDFLLSGRIHGAVQGLSQFIPTGIIEYGHEPKAHKLRGFATLCGMEDLICCPSDLNEMKRVVKSLVKDKEKIVQNLKKNIPLVQDLARQNFNLLTGLVVDEEN
jgi:colanic acid/amylovoran biosynthesis protein